MSKGIRMSLADAQEHQRKNGFLTDTMRSVEMPVAASKPIRGSRQPNKTESEFGRILEAQKQRGEVAAYFYEGITLHWGDCLRYTPDYVVYRDLPVSNPKPLLIECKNAHIFPNGLIRFKGCRAQWKEFYDFEMWQKKGGSWARVL